MNIDLVTFASFISIAVGGLIFLAFRMQKEATGYISELHFFLKQKTQSHNIVKARLAVLQTRFERIEQENLELKSQQSLANKSQASFTSEIANSSFIEEHNSKIEELELEITSIQQSLNGDFKEQLASYLTKVDGLSQKLDQAKTELTITEDFKESVEKSAS